LLEDAACLMDSRVTREEEAVFCFFAGDWVSSGKDTVRFWGESMDGSARSTGFDGDLRGEGTGVLAGVSRVFTVSLGSFAARAAFDGDL
jgi:hypothetical protein